ncbi:MAG: hypothetical protein ACI8RZ_000011 [Myxococcota bacterium]|jgi:hypothetical protein
MVLILSMLLGCSAKTAVVKAPSPMDVSLAAARNNLDDRQVLPLPDPLLAAITAQLSDRNLTPILQPLSTLADARLTARRLEILSADGAPLVMLVETEALYTAQLEGRLRWTVQVTLTLDPADGEPTTSEFSVPVFLQFQHQDADDALLGAAPIIERHVGYLLDEYLSGL